MSCRALCVGRMLAVVIAPLALVAQPVPFSAATTAVLVAVAVWETASLTPCRASVAPSPAGWAHDKMHTN